MNMFKKNGGFTLVELIVVIAILAILAGVAVPAYSGYITKAKDAAVIVELDAVATAAQAANAKVGPVDQIVVATDKSITITYGEDGSVSTAEDSDFALFYGTEFKGELEGTSYEDGAWWTAAGWSNEAPADSNDGGDDGGETGGSEEETTT